MIRDSDGVAGDECQTDRHRSKNSVPRLIPCPHNVVHQLRVAWRDPGLYQHTPKSRGARNPDRTIAVALQPGA